MKIAKVILLAPLLFVGSIITLSGMNRPIDSTEEQNHLEALLKALPQALASNGNLAVFFINGIVNPILEKLNYIPKDSSDSTALHILVRMKWVDWNDIWKPGLAKEINEQDIFGNTPLHYAYVIAQKKQ